MRKERETVRLGFRESVGDVLCEDSQFNSFQYSGESPPAHWLGSPALQPLAHYIQVDALAILRVLRNQRLHVSSSLVFQQENAKHLVLGTDFIDNVNTFSCLGIETEKFEECRLIICWENKQTMKLKYIFITTQITIFTSWLL